MVLCIIFYIGTNNYDTFGGAYFNFFYKLKDFSSRVERWCLFCFVFKHISAVFIEICIILLGNAAPF